MFLSYNNLSIEIIFTKEEAIKKCHTDPTLQNWDDKKEMIIYHSTTMAKFLLDLNKKYLSTNTVLFTDQGSLKYPLQIKDRMDRDLYGATHT